MAETRNDLEEISSCCLTELLDTRGQETEKPKRTKSEGGFKGRVLCRNFLSRIDRVHFRKRTHVLQTIP